MNTREDDMSNKSPSQIQEHPPCDNMPQLRRPLGSGSSDCRPRKADDDRRRRIINILQEAMLLVGDDSDWDDV